MRRSRRISYLTQSYETNSRQEKGARGMRSTSSWSWKSPLDRLLRSRMATRPFQFTGMEERNTPKSELLHQFLSDSIIRRVRTVQIRL